MNCIFLSVFEQLCSHWRCQICIQRVQRTNLVDNVKIFWLFEFFAFLSEQFTVSLIGNSLLFAQMTKMGRFWKKSFRSYFFVALRKFENTAVERALFTSEKHFLGKKSKKYWKRLPFVLYFDQKSKRWLCQNCNLLVKRNFLREEIPHKKLFFTDLLDLGRKMFGWYCLNCNWPWQGKNARKQLDKIFFFLDSSEKSSADVFETVLFCLDYQFQRIIKNVNLYVSWLSMSTFQTCEVESAFYVNRRSL